MQQIVKMLLICLVIYIMERMVFLKFQKMIFFLYGHSDMATMITMEFIRFVWLTVFFKIVYSLLW